MKYLKTYKLFEADYFDLSPEERRYRAADRFDEIMDAPVLSTLNDISLDIENDFDVSIEHSTISESIPFIKIKIYKKNGGYFNFTEEIQEYLLRVYQFMREMGWYSKLEYKGGVTKKFYIRPDERMRTQDIQWIDENWPSVGSIEMTWSSSYRSPELDKPISGFEASDINEKTYEDKIQESVNRSRYSTQVVDTLVWEYGEEIKDIIEDIHIIEDMLLEIEDIGYYTTVGLSPMTMAGAASKPNLYVDIKNKSTDYTGPMAGRRREEFYGDLGEKRETVDETIERVLNYLEDKGYKLKFVHDNREGKPSEFEFINNPTSYQMQFTK